MDLKIDLQQLYTFPLLTLILEGHSSLVFDLFSFELSEFTENMADFYLLILSSFPSGHNTAFASILNHLQLLGLRLVVYTEVLEGLIGLLFSLEMKVAFALFCNEVPNLLL